MSWWSLRTAKSQGVNLSWFSMKRGEPWLRSNSTQRFKPDVAAQCSAVLPFCYLATKTFISIKKIVRYVLRTNRMNELLTHYLHKGLTLKDNFPLCSCLMEAYLQ
jgi:hypothetical protein